MLEQLPTGLQYIYRISLQDADPQPGTVKLNLASKMFKALADERIDENLEGKPFKSGMSMIYKLEHGYAEEMSFPRCCTSRRDTG